MLVQRSADASGSRELVGGLHPAVLTSWRTQGGHLGDRRKKVRGFRSGAYTRLRARRSAWECCCLALADVWCAVSAALGKEDNAGAMRGRPSRITMFWASGG